MKTILKRLLCTIFGHKYSCVGKNYHQTPIHECSRCGQRELETFLK
jgi:rRNA maturation endonuclease Nob1